MNFEILVLVFCSCFGYYLAQESCRTPNGEIAYCGPIRLCKNFIEALTSKSFTLQQKNFLQESKCGVDTNGQPLVCCGSLTDYEDASNRFSNSDEPNKLPSLLKQECGKFHGNKYIGKLNELRINEYPWVALIEYRNKDGSTGHHCGGVLISDKYVLTAAHCVNGDIISQFGIAYQVRLGEYDRSTDKDCVDVVDSDYTCYDNHQNVLIETILTHPLYRYNNGRHFSDTALLKLVKSVDFTDFIRPVCLTNNDITQTGTETSVVGWGIHDKNKGNVIKHLVTAFTISNEHCSQLNKANIILSASQFCAVKSGAQDKITYCGDSGGAIVKKNQNGTAFVLEGIESFSFTENNNDNNFIIVYTKVSEFTDWILEEVRP